MEPESSLLHSQVPAICPYFFLCLGRTKVSVQVRGFLYEYFVTIYAFYGEEFLAPRPTYKLEDHPLPVVRDFLFNIFGTTLHIAGRSSTRNLRTRHAVVTGTHVTKAYTHLTVYYTRVLIIPWPDQAGNKLGSKSGMRAISTTSRRELSSIPLPPLQGKAPK